MTLFIKLSWEIILFIVYDMMDMVPDRTFVPKKTAVTVQ
jgi:hypothetical protein